MRQDKTEQQAQIEATWNAPLNRPKRIYGWYVVGVLSFANTISFVDRNILSLFMESIRLDLSLTDTQVSVLPGMAYVLFYSLLALPMARLADRLSRRLIIMSGSFCWSLATAACGLATNFLQIFVGRVGVGVGEATLAPSAVSIISDYFPRHMLGRAIGVFTSHSLIGAGIAFLAGGYIFRIVKRGGDLVVPFVGTMHPWQMAFLIVSIPGFLVALMLATVREPTRKVHVEAGVPKAFISWRTLLIFVWRNRSPVLYVILGFAFVSSGQAALNVWVPTFFNRTFGWTAGDIGPPLGVINLIFGFSGVLVGGWLADTLRRRGYEDANLRVAMIAVAIGLPCTVLMPQAPGPIIALALYTPHLFCGMICLGTAYPSIPIIVPGQFKTQIAALYVLCASLLGYGLGPTFVAVMNDVTFGTAATLKYSMSIMSALLMLIGMGFMLAIRGHFLERAILLKKESGQ